jgi:hypothetical protein
LSLLSDFEDRVGRALEGGFANMFRAPVQPAELARKAGREMDRGKKLGVGKVYAPTLYTILLSPQDDRSLGGFSETLCGELETYLIGHARERNYELAVRPVVRFLVDRDLRLGRFDIIGELLSPEDLAAELGYTPDEEPFEVPREPSRPAAADPRGEAPVAAAPVEPAPVPVPVPTPVPMPVVPPSGGLFDADDLDLDFEVPPAPSAAEPAQPAEAEAPAQAPVASPTELLPTGAPLATVTVRGVDHDVVLRGDRAVVGRLAACEISISDVNASREHAVFERNSDGEWSIRDLGSTNGTIVNGQRVPEKLLRNGDSIVIGITELIYHEPRG